jgi:hypothetical protein
MILRSETLTETQRTAVLAELHRILESEFFRGSQRCSRFLEYSVRYVLEERPIDELKERIIGIEVFRKASDYDTAQDNIVRVTANEVRKRLAQYYGQENVPGGLVIQLPSGSYGVTLRWTDGVTSLAEPGVVPISTPAVAPVAPELPSPQPAVILPELTVPENTAPRSRPRRWWAALAGGLVAAILLGLLAYRGAQARDVVQGVWSPILESPRVLVISIAQPLAYRPASNTNSLVGPDDRMVPLPDAFVGTGDAFALADIVKLLSSRQKEWQLLAGNSTPSQALLAGPIVLIGDHSNRWTPDMMDNLRFYFGETNQIYDRSRSGVSWSLDHLSPDWKTGEDYAIVSRFTSPGTGQPVIVIGGLTNFGTEAAGVFITNQNLLSEALRSAPSDWRRKNFQFVLHTKIIGNTPERPTVVASNFW